MDNASSFYFSAVLLILNLTDGRWDLAVQKAGQNMRYENVNFSSRYCKFFVCLVDSSTMRICLLVFILLKMPRRTKCLVMECFFQMHKIEEIFTVILDHYAMWLWLYFSSTKWKPLNLVWRIILLKYFLRYRVQQIINHNLLAGSLQLVKNWEGDAKTARTNHLEWTNFEWIFYIKHLFINDK